MGTADTTADIREVPTYDLVEAARYFRMPKSTLRAWVNGQGRFLPVIVSRSGTPPHLLSFFNLVEAHVLNAIRREHEIPLQRVRIALDTLTTILPQSAHPLIDHRFLTDGVDLFVERLGYQINLSRPNQQVMRDIISAHLRRIEWDGDIYPVAFYPYSGTASVEERRTTLIDPRRSFGRRTIAGTGIATRIIAERYAAGETIAELALDYGLNVVQVEDAVRSEYELAA